MSIEARVSVKCPYCKQPTSVDLSYDELKDNQLHTCDTEGCEKTFVIEFQAKLHKRALKIGGR